MQFKAMIVEEGAENTFSRRLTMRSVDDLPPGEVLIRVRFSSLNYKDALSSTGNRGVTRNYPHTPGIDAAGEVIASSDGALPKGLPVLVTGYDLGMNTDGGFGQYVRVPASWVVPLPVGLSLSESMIFGTAGFTAALSVARLLGHGLTPDSGQILVTGATGGVGSLAVALLARLGFSVAAASGKPSAEDFLRRIGAAVILPRQEVLDRSPRPLLKSRWAAAVDTVGGEILTSTLKATAPGGAVTCCGNVASPQLVTTVFPFILRGISLYGIDSAACPMTTRRDIWQHLAGDWKPAMLETLATEVSLDALGEQIDRILAGAQTGRVLVNLDR